VLRGNTLGLTVCTSSAATPSNGLFEVRLLRKEVTEWVRLLMTVVQQLRSVSEIWFGTLSVVGEFNVSTGGRRMVLTSNTSGPKKAGDCMVQKPLLFKVSNVYKP
jgi:hypothetical protein